MYAFWRIILFFQRNFELLFALTKSEHGIPSVALHEVVMRQNYARLRNLKISCRKSTKFIYDTLVEKNSLLYKKLHELFLGAPMQF